MLRAVERTLGAIADAGRSDEKLSSLLRAYFYLVQQPLAEISEPLSAIDKFSFDAFPESDECEDLVLLTHVVELVWFRAPADGAWRTLLEKWLRICPNLYKKPLDEMKSRLTIQTQLTSPGGNFPHLSSETPVSLAGEPPLAKLWIQLMHKEARALDQTLEKLNAVTSPDSHLARLLFDFHHFNRIQGRFGDPQEVGLARRRLFTSSSPLLTFHELREAKLSEELGQLFRHSESGGASSRFHGFTLAMLCELAALRLWDWPAWCTSVQAQAEGFLEACRWAGTEAEMAAHGLKLAVQSVSYKPKEKDALIRNAISRLEFAREDVLADLGERVCSFYPLQKPDAFELLGDLSDLIPSKCWVNLAKWSVGFIEERRQGKHFGGPLTVLTSWCEILPFVEESSEIWTLLLPEALRQARHALVWRTEASGLWRAWFQNAPIDFTRQVGLEMLSVNTTDAGERDARSTILVSAEKVRPELAGVFSPGLFKFAATPLEKLSCEADAGDEMRAAAKKQYRSGLERLLKLAIPNAGATTFEFAFLSNSPIGQLAWDLEDIGLVRELTAAIDHPQLLARFVPNLLLCLQSLVQEGPKDFGEIILPRFCVWLENPPTSERPTRRPDGPFSTIQFHDSTGSEIPNALGWLGFHLRRKLGKVMDPILASWLHRSILNPEPRAIPIMLYAAIPAAASLPATARADLLATGQTLLLHLFSRHDTDERIGACLADALHYLAALLQREEHPLVQWNSDGGMEALAVIITKLTPILVACSRSTNPDVRACVAALIRNLAVWKELSNDLDETFKRLGTDNRARVRAEVFATTESKAPRDA